MFLGTLSKEHCEGEEAARREFTTRMKRIIIAPARYLVAKRPGKEPFSGSEREWLTSSAVSGSQNSCELVLPG